MVQRREHGVRLLRLQNKMSFVDLIIYLNIDVGKKKGVYLNLGARLFVIGWC